MDANVAVAVEVYVTDKSPAKRVIRPKKNMTKIQIDTPNDIVQPSPAPSPAPAPAPAPAPSPAPAPAPAPYCDPSLFTKRSIKRTITIPFYNIKFGINLRELLTIELAKRIEGHCSVEGYICPKSIVIQNHSSGRLSGANIAFDIVADCLICFPDEQSVIKCVVKTITQAGIRAGATELTDGCLSPIEVFLSRDMNNKQGELFSRIEENDILMVEVVGRRFVLHDTHVTVIAMLVDVISAKSSESSV